MIEIANEFLRKIFLDLGLEKGQAWLKKGELFGIGVLIRIKLVAGKWLLYQTCQKKKKNGIIPKSSAMFSNKSVYVG